MGKMSTVMLNRLRRIAESDQCRSLPGVLTVEEPNWSHKTDKALRRRGLITIRRGYRCWVLSITDIGYRSLPRTDERTG